MMIAIPLLNKSHKIKGLFVSDYITQHITSIMGMGERIKDHRYVR